MAALIEGATEDTASSGIVATGPILVTVTGTMPVGRVRITADIGGGEAVAYTHYAGNDTSLARLEFTSGVTFKAYLEGTAGGTLVNVHYIDVS